MADALILVDERNRAIGRGEKLAVHERALLHRAFSVFLVYPDGRVLLQQRSRAKYHSAGLWANSCCGHPSPGERTAAAARRRLREELGTTAATLRFGFRARYRTSLPNGLTENEIVYVYFGAAPDALALNPAEVAATSRVKLPELKRDIARRPARYAYWLRYYFKNHAAAIARGVAAVARVSRPVFAGDTALTGQETRATQSPASRLLPHASREKRVHAFAGSGLVPAAT
ncbi:MAG: isopentenyl-diphosphate Delta-isomerase [Verrucomicrobia bacterium]|nr:isopentenyl-diphosphate Delta-isomerase [Verrucomicrobiota bacterium]